MSFGGRWLNRSHYNGYVKTAETVCYEIFREILRYARAYESQSGFTVVAHPSVIDRLLTAEAPAVADLEHFISRVIKFQVENLYTQEQYDIILSWNCNRISLNTCYNWDFTFEL